MIGYSITSIMNIPEHIQRINASENVHESIKAVIQHLYNENIQKDSKIKQLESYMLQMTIKVNELERYESKDCLIFHNLPVGLHGSSISDTVAFIRDVLQVHIVEEDLKACHPLGRASNGRSPSIIAKFICFRIPDSSTDFSLLFLMIQELSAGGLG